MCLASSLLVHFRPSNVQESVAPVPEGCAVLYGILTNVCAGSVSLSSSLSHCGPLLSQLIAHTAIDGAECVIEMSPQCVRITSNPFPYSEHCMIVCALTTRDQHVPLIVYGNLALCSL